jgi:putative hydrolase of the HAD superfamily
MVLKAVLFDIDNTLIDFMTMKRKSCEAAIEAMINAGLKVDKEIALKELFLLYDKYGIEYKNIFEKLLKKITGLVDYRIMTHGIIAYRKIKETYLFSYSGAKEVLLNLKKNYKLAVVTDAPTRKAWYRLVALGIDNLFDVVVTAGDTKKRKNTAIPFNSALRKLGINPKEALMVGDYIERDVKTAKKLGIKTCFARYGFVGLNKPEIGSSGADFEINDIRELLEVVKRL